MLAAQHGRILKNRIFGHIRNAVSDFNHITKLIQGNWNIGVSHCA